MWQLAPSICSIVQSYRLFFFFTWQQWVKKWQNCHIWVKYFFKFCLLVNTCFSWEEQSWTEWPWGTLTTESRVKPYNCTQTQPKQYSNHSTSASGHTQHLLPDSWDFTSKHPGQTFLACFENIGKSMFTLNVGTSRNIRPQACRGGELMRHVGEVHAG